MAVAARFGSRVELLELGASGGLNLNIDRFCYTLGGVEVGVPDSTVRLAPTWEGPAPLVAPVEVVARAGVDLHPLDMTDDAVAQHMLAYIWPDQLQRVQNAQAAIGIARQYPPVITRADGVITRADGVEWLAKQLARTQADGVVRIIYHSIALVYFPPAAQRDIAAMIEAAGAKADALHPLAWLSLEAENNRGLPKLTLRVWPGSGEVEQLATAHPHGTFVQWLGNARRALETHAPV